MSIAGSAIGLPEAVAALLMVALNAYVLMGGADLGGGVWDLLATGPRRQAQRSLIASAIAPIWEANHVWLVIAVVICFTAFPPLFATLATVLHIPLTLMLAGIVLRGSAFVFRSYGGGSASVRSRWGRTFAIASTMTPILFGIVIGAVATGAVGTAQQQLQSATFAETFLRPWLAPFPLLVGALALLLFAQLAATYLTLVTEDPALREDFRRRALGSTVAGLLVATVAATQSPGVWRIATPVLLPQSAAVVGVALTGITSAIALYALWRRRYRLARVACGIEVSLILWLWAVGQFPYLIPSTITVRAAAAPAATLEAMLWVIGAGVVLLIPSLAYLLQLFSSHAKLTESS